MDRMRRAAVINELPHRDRPPRDHLRGHCFAAAVTCPAGCVSFPTPISDFMHTFVNGGALPILTQSPVAALQHGRLSHSRCGSATTESAQIGARPEDSNGPREQEGWQGTAADRAGNDHRRRGTRRRAL
eukprot:gene7343-9915_t